MAAKYQSETEKSVFPEKDIKKLVEPDHLDREIEYTVQRKDIDVIGHMHNLYYLNLAYEALPEQIYNQRPFDYIRIMYKKEMKLGEKVVCKYVKQGDKNIIVIKSKDEKVLHSIIELKK